jgi:hypothetical protein
MALKEVSELICGIKWEDFNILFSPRERFEILHNGWCYEQVCLAEMFKFSTNVIGKLAYSTCYTLAR